MNECSRNTHECHAEAVCINTVGSYNCSCGEGWLGDGKQCSDEDECLRSPPVCHSDATCTNAVGSFSCSCKQGFVGNGQECAGGSFVRASIPAFFSLLPPWYKMQMNNYDNPYQNKV